MATAARLISIRPLSLIKRIASGSLLPLLLLIFALVLLGGVWFVAITRVVDERRASTTDGWLETEALTRTFEERTLRVLRQVDEASQFLKYEYERHGGPLGLDDFERRHGMLANDAATLIVLADEHGDVVEASRPIHVDNISSEREFAQHRDSVSQDLIIGKSAWNPSTGHWTILATRRLNHRDGSFAGIITIAIDAAYFMNFYRRSELGSDGMLIMTRRDGAILANRIGSALHFGGVVQLDALNQEITAAESSAREIHSFLDDTPRFIVFRDIGDYDIVVGVGISEADRLGAYQARRYSDYWTSSIISLVIIAFFASVVVLSRRLQNIQKEVEHEHAIYLAAAEGSLDAFFIFQSERDEFHSVVDFVLTDLNARAVAMLGSIRGELIGRQLSQIPLLADSPETLGRLISVVESGTTIEEDYSTAASDGNLCWWHRQAVSTGKGIALTARDITDTRRYQAQLERLANFDTLTGLPNRFLFQVRLREALERAARGNTLLALLFVDLDHFKGVNDSLGHAAGDQLLKMVARAIERSVRASDSVCRLAGDEFMVIMEQVTNEDGIRRTAEKIVDELTKIVSIGGSAVSTSASVGISVYPGDATEPEALLRSADLAMYRAKEMGRNAFAFFSKALGERAYDRRLLERSLREAIERTQLFVVYQPKIDLRNGRVVGFEALVRWQHPLRGVVLPADFIAAAESTGLIIPLGAWVLDRVCADMAHWHASGLPDVYVSVNVSPAQFRRGNLVETVRDALARHQIRGTHLDLELTESAMMVDLAAAELAISEIKNLGLSISIDDFGTGYSSLTLLKRLDVDAVKVDRTFIADVSTDSESRAIVRAIIMMAKGLRIGVIAEGVETLDQLRTLRHLHCDEGQGFLFSVPVLALEVPALIGTIYAVVADNASTMALD